MIELLITGLSASLFTASFAALGGCLVFFKKKYSKVNITFLLNISAGVMLASALLTLLAPAIGSIESFNLGKQAGALLIVLSVLCGFGVAGLLNFIVPHDHEKIGHHGIETHLKAYWMFVFAIAVHKIPEGLAVGVAYVGHEIFNPKALALGIALQNIPEGLMVAVSLIAIGFSRVKSAMFAMLTGLMQPVGAVIGILTTGFSSMFIPFGMAMAGGCMLFVIINEVIPETYSCKPEERNAWGIFLGFLIMTYMAVVLG